jgi:HSP20 family molecular chaperone IbpA
MNRHIIWNPFTPFLSEDWPNDLMDKNWDISFEENELDMYETDNQVVVEVKCAGFKPENLEVTLEGKVLTIKGELK